MKNIANKSTYTHAEQLQAMRMQMALQQVFRGTVYDPSYGIKGISVKVQKGAILADRKSLRLVEADWEKQGVTKKITPQGTTYRITRK
jgi:hypothetical protein